MEEAYGKFRLIGLDHNQVVQLLGKSDVRNRISKTDYNYYLGSERDFMAIDDEWLVLKFNRGKVNETVINTD